MHPDEMRQYCTRGKYPSFQMHPWRIVFVSAMLSCRANWCRNCGHFMTFSRPFNLAVGIGAGLGSGCALPVNSASFIFQRHRKILARQISRRGRPRFFSHRKSLEQRSLRFPKGFSWKLSVACGPEKCDFPHENLPVQFFLSCSSCNLAT